MGSVRARAARTVRDAPFERQIYGRAARPRAPNSSAGAQLRQSNRSVHPAVCDDSKSYRRFFDTDPPCMVVERPNLPALSLDTGASLEAIAGFANAWENYLGLISQDLTITDDEIPAAWSIPMVEIFRDIEQMLITRVGPSLSALSGVVGQARSTQHFEAVASVVYDIGRSGERFVVLPTPRWLIHVHLQLVQSIRNFLAEISSLLNDAKHGGAISANLLMSATDEVADEVGRLFRERGLL